MTRCEHCQPLILDHLYGLLEGPDAAVVESHLRECPACAAARDEAARVQGLFAKAAKNAFPAVRFDAPHTGTEAPAKSPALAIPGAMTQMPARADSAGRTSRIAAFLPWAVAAAVVLAIPGTVIPVLGTLNRAQTARKDADTSAEKLTALLADREKVEMEIREPRVAAARDFFAKKQNPVLLFNKWLEEEKQILSVAHKTSVDVYKPASFQPGATNELQLVIHDPAATPNGRLFAEIRDQTDAVIFSQPLDTQRQPGERQLIRVPADTWTRLKPQSELFLVVANEDVKTGAKTKIQEPVRLLGPVFATMLVTDKAMYRPGETLYFRSLTLDRVTFRPPDRDQYLEYELYEQRGQKRITFGKVVGGTELVRIANDAVTPVLGPDGKPIRGVGCGAFSLPNSLQDGDYTLVLREKQHPAGFPATVTDPVVRPVKVRAGQVESYQKLAGFTAGSYTPGDVVEGWAALKFEDKPVAGATVRAFATADNNMILNEVAVQPPVTGPDGRANFRFILPPKLDQGDVRLKVEFTTMRGVVSVKEDLAERVPVVGRHVVVEFFPEGGELVAGVPCRVYFRATTPTGQPVDIKGTITDGRKTLAKVETLSDATPGANRGIGSFTFTPSLGIPVWLKLDSPAGMFAPLLGPDEKNFPVAPASIAGIPALTGVNAGFLLPKAASEGVAMTIPDAVTVPGQPIRVHLRSVGKTRNLVVGAYTRGRMSDEPQRITVEAGQLKEVKLMAGNDPRGGVVRVTVFEEADEAEGKPEQKSDLKPVAERLVFRKPGESLNLGFTTLGGRVATGGFAPGSSVDLNITATDEKGNPAAALLYAAAVNTGAAPGRNDRLLTTHFLIAGEITSPDAMEYADFLLTDNPKAAEVLDFVLATQGWRRFAEQAPVGYINRPATPKQEREHLLVSNGQYAIWTDPAALREQRRLYETYWPRYEAAVKAMNAAQAVLDAANADQSGADRARELDDRARQAREEAQAQAERANATAAPVERFSRAGWYGVAGFGLLAAMLGIVCLAHPAIRLPLGISTAGSLGLVAFLVIALVMAENTQAASQANAAKQDSAMLAPPAATTKDLPAPAAAEARGSEKEAAFGAEIKLNDGAPPPRGPAAMGFAPTTGNSAMSTGLNKDPFTVLPPTLPKNDPFPPAPAGGGFGGVGPGAAKMGVPDPRSKSGSGVTRIAPTTPTPTPSPAALPGGGAEMTLGSSGRWQPILGKPPITADDLKKRSDYFWSGADNPTRYSIPTRGGAQDSVALAASNPYSFEAQLARTYVEDRRKAVIAQMDTAVNQPRVVTLTTAEGVKQQVTTLAFTPFDMMAYNRIKGTIPTVTPLIVREYAGPRPGADATNQEPRDTILWQPIIVLPSDGKAKLTCQLGSAEGGYQVLIAGHTLDGRIGAVRGLIPIAMDVERDRIAEPGRPAPVPPKIP